MTDTPRFDLLAARHLDGVASNDEHAELLNTLTANPAAAERFAHFCRAEAKLSAHFRIAERAAHYAPARPASWWRKRHVWQALASAALLAVCVASFWYVASLRPNSTVAGVKNIAEPAEPKPVPAAPEDVPHKEKESAAKPFAIPNREMLERAHAIHLDENAPNDEAIRLYESYLERHPDTTFAAEICFDIGSLYGSNAKSKFAPPNREKMLFYYRKAHALYGTKFSYHNCGAWATLANIEPGLKPKLAYFDWLLSLRRAQADDVYPMQNEYMVLKGHPPELGLEDRARMIDFYIKVNLNGDLDVASTNLMSTLKNRTGDLETLVAAYPGEKLGALAQARLEEIRKNRTAAPVKDVPVAVAAISPNPVRKAVRGDPNNPTILLDASNHRTEQEMSARTFQWIQVGGEDLHFPSANFQRAVIGIRIYKSGIYRFQLIESDGNLHSAPVEVEVTVTDDEITPEERARTKTLDELKELAKKHPPKEEF